MNRVSFKEQLDRIASKLELAKAKDIRYENFGAGNHKYLLDASAEVDEINIFELQNHITLPTDFIAFITTLGNGGAGPYYGMYKLGEFGYMIANKSTTAFSCIVNSSLTEDRWNELTDFDRKTNSHDIEYYQKYDALFGGMLPIGTQGCSFQTMLILNGDFQGRVVSIDQDLQMPQVASEGNFLDWYEKWLDDILSSNKGHLDS
jgi:hypothetical protein